jgi:ABC-type cobalamin/Fe3+-siderophores transport system ATPase subunit
MTPITFTDVIFRYPGPEGSVSDEAASVFSGLDLELPGGFTFLVGPNGIGKTTLMLLAGARIFPEGGTVSIGGRDSKDFLEAGIDPETEQKRNELVSFVYQNMEFETDEPIGAVLSMVARDGADQSVIEAAGLDGRLNVPMHQLSKGEMQRAIIAMSVLFGSPVVMMDEPVFAVEPDRAERLFSWLKGYCRRSGVDIYISVHDVELARKFADSVILFHQDGPIQTGPAGDLLTRERLEAAFKAPWDTLYRRQNLYRQLLRSGTVSEEEDS